MNVRVDLLILLVVAFLVGVALVARALTNRHTPQLKDDLWAVPSDWFTFSEPTADGRHVVYGVQRVARESRKVLEREEMGRLDCSSLNYAEEFDLAMDEAHRVMRAHNVHLHRR